MIVDTLEKVSQILAILNPATHSSQFKKMAFVQKWSQLSREQQDFYYSEYASHELNFFLKQRYPAYFESVCRLMLTNKIQKSFVDLYLLDCDEEMLAWRKKPRLLAQMNAFEKCLLIKVLVRNSQAPMA